MTKAGSCRICDELAPGHLIELNLLLSDPNRWPRTAFGRIRIPDGPLPRQFRLWGATKMGLLYLKEHGYTTIRGQTVTKHWRFDVPHYPESLASLAADGAMAAPGVAGSAVGPPLTPLNLVSYLQKGLEVGKKALDMLYTQLETAEAAKTPIAMSTLLEIANMGSRIAVAQGGWAAKGFRPDNPEADQLEGFRAGAAPPASPRMGHSRVREIDGESRPVRDEGPRDRETYNRRAAQEGGTLLPARPQ